MFVCVCVRPSWLLTIIIIMREKKVSQNSCLRRYFSFLIFMHTLFSSFWSIVGSAFMQNYFIDYILAFSLPSDSIFWTSILIYEYRDISSNVRQSSASEVMKLRADQFANIQHLYVFVEWTAISWNDWTLRRNTKIRWQYSLRYFDYNTSTIAHDITTLSNMTLDRK